MNKKIFTQPVHLRLKSSQYKNLNKVCDQLEITHANFIRDALDEKINQYLVSAK